MLALLPLAAFGRTLSAPTLPPPEFADTEVSTNIPIRVNLERLEKMRFALELAPTATFGNRKERKDTHWCWRMVSTWQG